MIERVTHLSAPPVIGVKYLVPTVFFEWIGSAAPAAYPVFPFKHEDGDHLSFPWFHYHVDPRFLSARVWRRAQKYLPRHYEARGRDAAFSTCQAAPLHRFKAGAPFSKQESRPMPPPEWRPLICKRNEIPYQFADKIAVKLGPHFKGAQCRRVRTGWVCPHKRFPLGSLAPVDGVITCPLHGLQIDAETGLVLGPTARAA